MIEFTTEIGGRLVGGHPLTRNAVKNKHGELLKDATGSQITDAYVAVAVPKKGESDWKQTSWGQQIVSEAKSGWPNGEFNSPTFAWKIVDGDSNIPNKKGNKPCDREGYPGNWVLQLTTRLPIKLYIAGDYHNEVIDKNVLKPGDYVRAAVSCKANNPSESPGVYLNPVAVVLDKEGPEIQLSTFNAESAFGGSQTQITPDTGYAESAVAPPQAPVPEPQAPVPQEKPNRVVSGVSYSHQALLDAKWTEESIEKLPIA